MMQVSIARFETSAFKSHSKIPLNPPFAKGGLGGFQMYASICFNVTDYSIPLSGENRFSVVTEFYLLQQVVVHLISAW